MRVLWRVALLLCCAWRSSAFIYPLKHASIVACLLSCLLGRSRGASQRPTGTERQAADR